MQHYGTPTRLIDFSHSFYVACYFALINSRADAAVWAIDHSWLLGIGEKAFNLTSTGLRDEWEDKVYTAGNEFLGNILSTASNASYESDYPSLKGAISVEPFQFNKRLSSQQGLFILPLDITSTLNENLASHLDLAQNLRKVVLKHEIKETALAHLRAMNITSESLFPGIEGFAKSITHKWLCQ